MLQETYKIVQDENILESFLKKLGAEELSNLESYLVVSAFRSKKLDAAERSKIGARHREIYLTKTLKKRRGENFDFEAAINRIYELEVPVKALTFDKENLDNKVQLPQKALVCYIQPNPVKEIDVAISHMESTLDIVKNYIYASSKDDSANQLAHHNTDYRSERSTCLNKVWVDFDIDIPEITSTDRDKAEIAIKKAIRESLNNFGQKLLIRSAGGWHILVKKAAINCNPQNICKKINEEITSAIGINPKEVDFKSSGYVPLPGTLQYGEHMVTFEEF